MHIKQDRLVYSSTVCCEIVGNFIVMQYISNTIRKQNSNTKKKKSYWFLYSKIKNCYIVAHPLNNLLKEILIENLCTTQLEIYELHLIQ